MQRYTLSHVRALSLLLAFPIAGCGYHRVGGVIQGPANVRTLAVPIFQSKVQAFRTETVFTAPSCVR